uniref:Uncharacterized protein n=1 Tax=Rousettus aegyptiacus TaxID=9407 RepID=A0A7J8H103_ROUAE|nr:hypothetical protein HJG63_011324 [Rousettus aegyptiacus]
MVQRNERRKGRGAGNQKPTFPRFPRQRCSGSDSTNKRQSHEIWKREEKTEAIIDAQTLAGRAGACYEEEETPELALCHARTQEKVAICKPRRESSLEPNYAGISISDFSVSKTMKNSLYCFRHPV